MRWDITNLVHILKEIKLEKCKILRAIHLNIQKVGLYTDKSI